MTSLPRQSARRNDFGGFMVFSSLTFLFIFLMPVVLLHRFAPVYLRNGILLAASLLFYAWGEPVYIVVMLFSSLVDYFAGRFMDRYDSDNKKRTGALLVSLIINLGLLFVFKYSSFFIGTLNDITGLSISDPKLPLPIGISFYTFQSMSYTIDLYMRRIKVQKNALSFITYVSLFPQLVAGPIVRYEDVQNEIDSREVTFSGIGEGVGIFVRGLAKKVLLANNIGLLWTQVKAEDFSSISMLSAWLGIVAFSMQIYFDFSGYSDMAIGLGHMFGFRFPKNFDHPYTAGSVTEFWRRWHMTLTGWFRTYVYIPLGGNRRGTFKTLRNIVIVWALTGLWHGASWNFVLWGLYFALILIIEKNFLMPFLEKLPRIVRCLYSYILVLFGWVLFDTDTLSDSAAFIRAMFGGNGVIVGSDALYRLRSYFLILLLCIIACGRIREKLLAWLLSLKNGKTALCVAAPVIELALMLVCTAYLVNETYNPFLYFRF